MYFHAMGNCFQKKVLIVVCFNLCQIITTKIKQMQLLRLSEVIDMNHQDLLISEQTTSPVSLF